MTHRPFGEVEVSARGEVAGHGGQVAVARSECAGRAVTDRAARVLDGAFGVASALADTHAGEADPGVPDDSHQPRAMPAGVHFEAGEKVLGPAGVVPGVPVRLVEGRKEMAA